MLVNLKIHRHLKELAKSKIFMVFTKIYAHWKKNILFLYTENRYQYKFSNHVV